MDTGAISWSPITTSHLLGRNKWAPPDMAGDCCAHKNPKFWESSLKGLWTFPQQTLITFWFCYESRWNQVVLTEFFFEVWFGSQKSKAKLKDWKAKWAKNLCCMTLSETRQRGPQSHGARPQCPPPGLTCWTDIRQWAWKDSIPQIKRVIWVMQPPWEGFAWNTKIIHLLASSVSCNHKVACEEETWLNPGFCSNVSEQLDNIQLK